MKLLSEIQENDIEYLKEDLTEGQGKNYFVKGIFLEGAVKNRNGRIYPAEILEREVYRYNEEFIKPKRSISNLDHPSEGTLKLADAACICVELKYDKNENVAYGKSKFLDTPTGRIGKILMDEGIKLAVSSRGVGSLQEGNVVAPDYKLLAIDIVSNPSASRAMMDAVYESKEYILDGSGNLVEMAVANLEKNLAKHGSRNLYNDLNKFINQLRNRI